MHMGENELCFSSCVSVGQVAAEIILVQTAFITITMLLSSALSQ